MSGLLACVVAYGPAAFAHHGTADYDTTRSIVLQGPVTDFQFINPHALIFLDVKDEDGKVQNWKGELASPGRLSRFGWQRDTVKPGEVLSISGYPAKSGAPLIWISKVRRATGEELKLGN